MNHSMLAKFWVENDRIILLMKFAVMVVFALILGAITPYNSSELPYKSLQYGYWLASVLFGFLVSVPLGKYLLPYFRSLHWNPFVSFLAFCSIIAIPVYGFVMLEDLFLVANYRLGVPMFSQQNITAFDNNVADLFGIKRAGYIIWYMQVYIIVLLVFGGAELILEKLAYVKPAESDHAEVQPGTVFFNRLPHSAQKDLKCIAVEDHYVRVYSGASEHLILMRMADAVAELEGYPGMQVHRSWWVAYDAIANLTKDGRRYVAILTDGRRVPVSKTYFSELKAKLGTGA